MRIRQMKKEDYLAVDDLMQQLHQQHVQGRPDIFIHMDGPEVFKFAVKSVPTAIETLLHNNNMDINEVDKFILHQANVRIIESVAKRLKADKDKFPVNLNEYGNTSSASIPILLDELNRNGSLKQGEKLVLAGFGAGLSWGSILLVW